MILSKGDLLNSNTNLYNLIGTEKDLAIFIKDVQTELNTATILVRGNRCSSKLSFLQEWAAALKFPNYFGYNWDAFEECLNDLSWLHAKQYLIFIANSSMLLHESRQDLTLALDILKKAGEECKRKGKSFKVLFHFVSENEIKENEVFIDISSIYRLSQADHIS